MSRPLISNIDYLGITFAATAPKFDFTNFQKFLLNSFIENVNPILIITKSDLLSKLELDELVSTIEQNFHDLIDIFVISTNTGDGLRELIDFIKSKNIIIAGPSGVGKSSLINKLVGEDVLIVNDVSKKTERGRHTTTESRFFKIKNSNTFIVDTPGFSTVDFPILKNKKDLDKYFPDFDLYVDKCKFRDCIHTNEPNCAIKENVDLHNISKLRYDFYIHVLTNIFK